MEFGTAGLRSRMGAGNSMMNDLTIIQTAQGFFQYLESYFTISVLKQKGIVIGFDSRHNSQRFAQLTANVFLRKEIPVYLFGRITPTPFVVSMDFFKFLLSPCNLILLFLSHLQS
jgi:phosphoglucomutase/phosphopentomutase